jgi:hypothetical protein
MSDLKPGIEALVSLASQRMAAASEAYRDGTLTAAQWQAEQMATIKSVHIAAALAAYGGVAAMNQSRWGTVGQIIRQQYAYQRAFLADVLEGRQVQNGRMDNRARQYASAARATYQNITRREQADAGMRYERNMLGAHESCRACQSQSAMGWVPVGTLSPIGSRSCRGNCRCDIAYAEQRPLEDIAS